MDSRATLGMDMGFYLGASILAAVKALLKGPGRSCSISRNVDRSSYETSTQHLGLDQGDRTKRQLIQSPPN